MERQIFVLIIDNSDKQDCLKEHHVRSNITWNSIMIFRITPKQKLHKENHKSEVM